MLLPPSRAYFAMLTIHNQMPVAIAAADFAATSGYALPRCRYAATPYATMFFAFDAMRGAFAYAMLLMVIISPC